MHETAPLRPEAPASGADRAAPLRLKDQPGADARIIRDAAGTARAMPGGIGVSADDQAMRPMINPETVNTRDIHALIPGRAQTGRAAFA